jgi:hypothetical protein
MRAKVVAITTPRERGRFSLRRRPGRAAAQVRLAFLESCPYDLFKASISGFVVERAGANSLAER